MASARCALAHCSLPPCAWFGQQLYKAADVTAKLRQVGFEVETTQSYGQFHLPKGRVVFIAHKSA